MSELTRLEQTLCDLLNTLSLAQNMTDVNIAAGIALSEILEPTPLDDA